MSTTTTIALLCCYCCLFFANVDALGCIPALCDDTSDNQIANVPCNTDTKHCGAYNGKRSDNSLVKGVDIRCGINKTVKAPFDGILSFYRPRGGQTSSSCLDSGLQIVGSGQWQGYIARIAFIRPILYSSSVKQGARLGRNIDQACVPSADMNKDDHILFTLYKEGKEVDPTHHLTQCMCTGQICETNINNALIGQPFAHKPLFGKGYEISCKNHPDRPTTRIFNPIEASALGRFRPFKNLNNESFACENDGVFLEGHGKWQDFIVHIYNVHFVVEPGRSYIGQGVHIANRLECGDKTPESVFVEFRYKGRLVDVSKMVSAGNCSLPKLLPD